MKRVIQYLNIIIVLSCLIFSCSDDQNIEIDNGPYDIKVVNETCTTWKITENNNNIVTVNPNDSNTFKANKGQHTYMFTPQPEKCVGAYGLFQYEYESGEITTNINRISTIKIYLYGLISYPI